MVRPLCFLYFDTTSNLGTRDSEEKPWLQKKVLNQFLVFGMKIGQNYTKLIINESEPGGPLLRFLKNLNASVENEREIGWGLLFLTCEHHIQIGRPQILFSHCTEYWKFVLSQNLYLSYSKGQLISKYSPYIR